MSNCMLGVPFIYDNIPSEIYGLSLVFINQDYNFVPSGSGFEVISEQLVRSPYQKHLGEIQSPILEFPITIYCNEDMDVFKQVEMKNWLFGQYGYKKLQICSDDYKTFFFNCKLFPNQDIIFTAFEGFECTVQCNSPYAQEFIKTKTFSNPTKQFYDILFNSLSGDVGYMYPTVELKTTINNNAVQIINKSDNNRVFEFTGLQGEETIFIDNQKKIIRSSTGLNRLTSFNKKFFRLHRGVNELQVIGTCEYIKITYQNVKRLGGAVY